MKVSPKWKKVARDIWSSKVRSLLVVLSIAIGVFAIGAVMASSSILASELDNRWKDAAPNHAEISLSGVGADWVRSVRTMSGIADAEGRNITFAYVILPDGSRKAIQVNALADFADIRIDHISLIQPTASMLATLATRPFRPASHQIAMRQMVLEKNSLEFLGVKIGDEIAVEMPNNRIYKLRVAQTAHNPKQLGNLFMFNATGYVTQNTWAWLGMPAGFNTVLIRASSPQGLPEVQALVDRIKIRAQRAGIVITEAKFPDELDRHPAHRTLQGILLLMGFMGAIALALSGFLIINTVSAILAQQIRQVGMMKAIGAQPRHLAHMYAAHSVAYGLLALCIAVPLGALGAHVFVNAISRNLLNFSIAPSGLNTGVILVQASMSIAVPLLSSVFPIRNAANKTVQEAMNDYGLETKAVTGNHGSAVKSRLAKTFSFPAVPTLPLLSRATRMSLRNVFRRKKRLMLTLSILALAGAFFVGVLCLRQSLISTLDVALDYWRYDVGVFFSRDYPRERLEEEALQIPGVTRAESWGFSRAQALRSTQPRPVTPQSTSSPGPDLLITAPPADTHMLNPIVVQGRWLMNEDRDTIVFNTEALRLYPELKLGDLVALELNSGQGKTKATFKIVGVVQGVLTGPIAYINRPAFARATRTQNRYSSLVLQTAGMDDAAQITLTKAVENHFRKAGFNVGSAQPTSQLRAAILMQFDLLTYVLLGMATLLAVIGGLGLAGTMSINVIERTRELGVMRAIGAQNHLIRKIVVAEGVAVGGLSAFVATLLSVPISYGLMKLLVSVLQFQVYYTFSVTGLLIWLILVVVVSALSSLWPAIGAARTTVREALAYI